MIDRNPNIPAVSAEDVLAARLRIAPHVRETPLVRSAALSGQSGGEVFLKLESAQLTHSFKVRGALSALMQLSPGAGGHGAAGDHGSAGDPLIVTASAGNHGLAIAWAAERLGRKAIVFTPRDAPRAKTGPIVSHGAELRAVAANYEEAEALAREFAVEHGATFISPYNHPAVIAGAGTIGLELLDQEPSLDTILVPIGGGGLIGGVALAAKSKRPSMRIVGVEAAASAAFTAARAAGRVVEIQVGRTVADGLGGNVEPETITWPLIRDHVDRIVTAREDDIIAAIRHLSRVEHVTAEGAGATAVAAVLSRAVDLKGRTAAVIVTGGNIDRERLEGLLTA